MKPGHTLRITEADITRQIRDLLRLCRIWHWKAWQGPMSQPAGVADILGVYQGRMMAIEVKVPKGKVSVDQQRFLDRVNREGGIGFVARSADDVAERLGLSAASLGPIFSNPSSGAGEST